MRALEDRFQVEQRAESKVREETARWQHLAVEKTLPAKIEKNAELAKAVDMAFREFISAMATFEDDASALEGLWNGYTMSASRFNEGHRVNHDRPATASGWQTGRMVTGCHADAGRESRKEIVRPRKPCVENDWNLGIMTTIRDVRRSVEDIREITRTLRSKGRKMPGGVMHRTGVIERAGDGAPLDFVMSDETPNRMGDVVRADGWELDRFRRNLVALWAHDGQSLPIGKWSNVRVEGKELRGH